MSDKYKQLKWTVSQLKLLRSTYVKIGQIVQ